MLQVVATMPAGCGIAHKSTGRIVHRLNCRPVHLGGRRLPVRGECPHQAARSIVPAGRLLVLALYSERTTRSRGGSSATITIRSAPKYDESHARSARLRLTCRARRLISSMRVLVSPPRGEADKGEKTGAENEPVPFSQDVAAAPHVPKTAGRCRNRPGPP